MLQSKNCFEIKSYISQVYTNCSQMALGFFVININDKTYGVEKPDASMLSCSYNCVKERLRKRGYHVATKEFDSLSGLEIAQITNAVLYSNKSLSKYCKINIKPEEIQKNIIENHLLWAPDGDEAFDDNSRILHFDISKSYVRLIACKIHENEEVDESSLSDVVLDSDFFYNTLYKWSESFYQEWSERVKKETQT